jgi:hypothetical protein
MMMREVIPELPVPEFKVTLQRAIPKYRAVGLSRKHKEGPDWTLLERSAI